MSGAFISHATIDRDFVKEELGPALEAVGIRPWVAEHDIRTAEDWQRSIPHALKNNDWFIVVLTRNSVNSDWVRAETNWAFSHRALRIVPLLLEECDTDDLNMKLGLIQHIDFRNRPQHKALLDVIKFFREAEDASLRRVPLLLGKWKGVTTQEIWINGQPINLPYTMTLEAKGSQICGHLTAKSPNPDGDGQVERVFRVKGEFIFDRFVRLTYSADVTGMVHFGSVIGELSADGRKLTGRFIGYSIGTKEIAFGKTDAEKEEPT